MARLVLAATSTPCRRTLHRLGMVHIKSSWLGQRRALRNAWDKSSGFGSRKWEINEAMTPEDISTGTEIKYYQARWAILKDKELQALKSGNMVQEIVYSTFRDEVYAYAAPYTWNPFTSQIDNLRQYVGVGPNRAVPPFLRL